ncbi:MAG: recombinase family protein [Candidatus Hydrogenedentota bacterium]
MKQVFGYVRVSTVRQGERGVSLQEQRDAITRYCATHNLTLAQWFEERETAAKSGRRQFNEMLRQLDKGSVAGLVLHKVDRGARNLGDWARLGDLLDRGVEIHFANEGLDLNSRGGRLSADIQAVVASDYIRNLREEVMKGFYGRLKQGYYPRPAPLGYQDNGAAKPKTPHPIYGPLVKRAFELYATGQYGLVLLLDKLYTEGLRNRNGGPVSRSALAKVLRNPFYIGVIRLRRTGETYAGLHPPLISKALFDAVQAVLDGKAPVRSATHDFVYRRTLTCAACSRSLTGERQKGRVYYRCHGRRCPKTSVREDNVETVFESHLQTLTFTPAERTAIQMEIAGIGAEQNQEAERVARGLRLQLDALEQRLQRTTDAFIDQLLDKESFAERKETLLAERVELRETLNRVERGETRFDALLSQVFERADLAWLTFKMGSPQKKRELLDSISSNRKVRGKIVCVELKPVFQLVANRSLNDCGGPHRADVRTFLAKLSELLVRVPPALFQTANRESNDVQVSL